MEANDRRYSPEQQMQFAKRQAIAGIVTIFSLLSVLTAIVWALISVFQSRIQNLPTILVVMIGGYAVFMVSGFIGGHYKRKFCYDWYPQRATIVSLSYGYQRVITSIDDIDQAEPIPWVYITCDNRDSFRVVYNPSSDWQLKLAIDTEVNYERRVRKGVEQFRAA